VIKLPHGKMDRREGKGDAAVERWLQEARILARLDNPHIVRVVNSGRTRAGRPFIALEALDGETLQQRLRRDGRVAPREALTLMIGVLRALEDAHAAGVVHRDLKPDNLFLHRAAPSRPGDPAWQLKVLDFGIAKVVSGALDPELKPLHLTGKSQVLGTPRYLAPEQIAKQREVDARTDLYAVGLILFITLVGEGPFDLFQDVSHLLGAHLQVIPSLVSTQFEQRHPGEQLPFAARFDEILARALRKAPEERFQSARELRHELEALLEKVIACEPFRPGEAAGKYQLRRLLAQDRTSSVWEALDPALSRPAIVKILEPAHVDQTELRRYFERDARVLAGIRHPNVAGIYDFGYERGRPWIAMESAPGQPLRRMLGGSALPARLALGLCTQIAAGVWEAHRRGVLHGNLSSANVFVSRGGESRAVVTDFGTTATLDQQKGALSGVLAYQAPEAIYALGDRSAQSPQSDVFSLGVVAYEMLSGRLPCANPPGEPASAEQSLRSQLFEDPPPLHELDRTIPAYVSAVVTRALHKEAALRYASMREAGEAFAAALERHSQEGPTFSLRLLQTKLGATLTGAVLALLLSLLLVGTTKLVRPVAEQSSSVSPESVTLEEVAP
jgi:serine/threonine protein kinase